MAFWTIALLLLGMVGLKALIDIGRDQQAADARPSLAQLPFRTVDGASLDARLAEKLNNALATEVKVIFVDPGGRLIKAQNFLGYPTRQDQLEAARQYGAETAVIPDYELQNGQLRVHLEYVSIVNPAEGRRSTSAWVEIGSRDTISSAGRAVRDALRGLRR